jgi:hypothetical protein
MVYEKREATCENVALFTVASLYHFYESAYDVSNKVQGGVIKWASDLAVAAVSAVAVVMATVVMAVLAAQRSC